MQPEHSRADTRQRSRGALCLPLLTLCAGALSLALSGCGDYGVGATAGSDTLTVALAKAQGGGEAHLFLYRTTSQKTGERLGVGRLFEAEQSRQARAVLRFEDIAPGTPLHVHFLWLNPDGKEVYTKETLIRAGDWRDAARRDSLAKALVSLDPERGIVELESRYGISPEKFEEELHKPEEERRFKEGTWTVRTYLFRKRFLETTFELRGSP